jgi:shikimate dehydrogenase
MIKAAVLGSPIAHSLSPLIHQTAYKELGVEGTYEAIEVVSSEFARFIDRTMDEAWTGFSLTMPLKEEALSMGFEIDSRSLRIGSTNTLLRRSDSYVATSTDILAFDRLLDRFSFSSVAVIGGGGTARAALGALDGRVKNVDLLLRDDHRRVQISQSLLATEFDIKPMHTDVSDYDLVIATTPAHATDELAASIRSVNGTLIECLYHPMPTELLARWRMCGGEVLDGLDLLVEQALDQIHLMTAMSFDYSSMRGLLMERVRKEISKN